MDFLGYFGIDEYICFPLQASGTSGSAADIDSGSWTINFYEKSPSDGNAPAAMTTPDTTFNTKLDSKTGLYYAVVQMTSANGFEAGKQYFARVTGTVDGETPAALYGFYVLASPLRTYLANLDAAITSRSSFDASSDEVDIGEVKGVGVSGVADFKADVSNLDATVSSRSTFDPASDEVDIGEVKGVAVAGVNDFKADVSNLDATVSSRSTFDPASDEVDVGEVKGVAVAGVNDFKADVSNLDATVSSRSTFDASSDEVDIGKVKGVGVSGVADFKADVSNLDVAVSTRSDFDESTDEVDIGAVKGAAVAGVSDFKADVSNLDATISSRSTFDPTSDEVDIGKVKGAAVANVDDFKANVSALATTANLAVVGGNVDAIKAITDTLASIDGLSVNTVLKIMVAITYGNFNYNTITNAFTYLEQDGLTPFFTLTINRVTGNRTRS